MEPIHESNAIYSREIIAHTISKHGKKEEQAGESRYMAKVVERGSFLWFMVAATQLWLSILMMEEATQAVATLFGSSAAACFVLGLFVFKREQMEMKLNPLKDINKEVHEDFQKQQGNGLWTILIIWLVVMTTSTFIF